jgi:hypothetical protein
VCATNGQCLQSEVILIVEVGVLIAGNLRAWCATKTLYLMCVSRPRFKDSESAGCCFAATAVAAAKEPWDDVIEKWSKGGHRGAYDE